MSKAIDITGNRYGRLVAVKFHSKNKRKQHNWLYECDCGNRHIANKADVARGNISSCGCYRDDCRLERLTKHNLRHHPLYSVWHNMMQRCYNKNSSHYQYYGARGVYVCDRWHNVVNFIEDMKDGYKEDLQIDKDLIDQKNKCYCPEKCIWVTQEVNQLYRRSATWVYYKNIKLPLSVLAKTYDLKIQTLRRRIFELKWDIERSLKTPV